MIIEFAPCIGKRQEAQVLIETLGVQPMLSFYTAVVSRCSHSDAPVSNAQFMQCKLETACLQFLLTKLGICKLVAVVSLCLPDSEWRGFNRVTQKL